MSLDDKMPDNPKVDPLSDGAFRLYVSALCHAQAHMTDGHIERSRPPRLVPHFDAARITELVDAGLWEPVDDGYRIHDFEVYNKTRAHWLERRAKDAGRQQKLRAQRKRGTYLHAVKPPDVTP